MIVSEFAQRLSLQPICTPDLSRSVEGAYTGDLLSWVMGRAEAGNVWITIMSNINTIAVATLTDASCIILAEDVSPDDTLIKTAISKGVNLLSTHMSAYDMAVKISKILP